MLWQQSNGVCHSIFPFALYLKKFKKKRTRTEHALHYTYICQRIAVDYGICETIENYSFISALELVDCVDFDVCTKFFFEKFDLIVVWSYDPDVFKRLAIAVLKMNKLNVSTPTFSLPEAYFREHADKFNGNVAFDRI